jgi:hypothetical protein
VGKCLYESFILAILLTGILVSCDKSPSIPGSSPDNPLNEQPLDLTAEIRHRLFLPGTDTSRTANHDRYAAYMVLYVKIGKQEIPCMLVTYGTSFDSVGAIIDAKKQAMGNSKDTRIVKTVELDLLTGLRTTKHPDLYGDPVSLQKLYNNQSAGFAYASFSDIEGNKTRIFGCVKQREQQLKMARILLEAVRYDVRITETRIVE